MNKVRSDALWNELSAEQLETLDKWLFEEKLGYRETLSKAQKELGFKGSYSSLVRYYQRRSQERELERLLELNEDAEAVGNTPGDVKKLRVATMKMVAARAFQQVREAPEDADKWDSVVRMMVEYDRNETLREEHEVRRKLKAEEEKLRRELKAEDHKIRREAMEFAKEKFQMNMIEQALKAMPELQ
jgi:hypothetical protein